jgi:hypothetical protein
VPKPQLSNSQIAKGPIPIGVEAGELFSLERNAVESATSYTMREVILLPL